MTTKEKVEKTKLSQEALDLLLISAEDADIARYICETGEGKYKTESKKAYMYNEATKLWEETESPENFFTTEYPKMLKRLKKIKNNCIEDGKIIDKYHKDNPDAEAKLDDVATIAQTLKNVEKAEIKLKSNAKCRNVSNLLSKATYLDIPGFFKILDSYRHLLPIRGGQIYDFTTKEKRERKMQDYFTVEMPVDFTDDLRFGEEYFRSIANETDLEEASEDIPLYKFISYVTGLCFSYQHLKNFFMLTGDTDSGKSVYLRLVGKMLGDFCIAENTTFLNKDKNAGRNTQNQTDVDTEKARCVTIGEADSYADIDDNRLKDLTGGDANRARGMYGPKKKEIIPLFKLLIASNDFLNLDVSDKAIKRRMKTIKFQNKFPENPNYAKDIISNKKGELDSIFSHAIRTFEAHNEKMGQCCLPDCKKVESFTKEAQEHVDPFHNIMEQYVETKKSDDFVFVSSINQAYACSVFPKILTRRETSTFQKYLVNKFGKAVVKKKNKAYVGIRAKTESEKQEN